MRPADKSSFELARRPALEWLLRVSVALTLLGRAWQHLRYDTPLSALLWSQDLFAGIASAWFGMEWQEWATSPQVVRAIAALECGQGMVYLLAGTAALLPLSGRGLRRAQVILLLAATLGLVGLSGLNYLDHKRQAAQLFELSIQCSAPAILACVLMDGGRLSRAHQYWLRLAIAATFVGHGMYAVGYYEVPGQFVTMVMRSLYVSEDSARLVLRIAGATDLVVALAVLLSTRLHRFEAAALIYATTWGVLTALARIWSFFRWDMAFERLVQWLHETALRLPHGLLPLFVLLVLLQQAQKLEPQPEATP